MPEIQKQLRANIKQLRENTYFSNYNDVKSSNSNTQLESIKTMIQNWYARQPKDFTEPLLLNILSDIASMIPTMQQTVREAIHDKKLPQSFKRDFYASRWRVIQSTSEQILLQAFNIAVEQQLTMDSLVLRLCHTFYLIKSHKLFDIIEQLQAKNVPLSAAVFGEIFAACAEFGEYKKGHEYWEKMASNVPDHRCTLSYIKMITKQGKNSKAYELFDALKASSLIEQNTTWNYAYCVIFHTCMEWNDKIMAQKYVHAMFEQGIKADLRTYGVLMDVSQHFADTNLIFTVLKHTKDKNYALPLWTHCYWHVLRLVSLKKANTRTWFGKISCFVGYQENHVAPDFCVSKQNNAKSLTIRRKYNFK